MIQIDYTGREQRASNVYTSRATHDLQLVAGNTVSIYSGAVETLRLSNAGVVVPDTSNLYASGLVVAGNASLANAVVDTNLSVYGDHVVMGNSVVGGQRMSAVNGNLVFSGDVLIAGNAYILKAAAVTDGIVTQSIGTTGALAFGSSDVVADTANIAEVYAGELTVAGNLFANQDVNVPHGTVTAQSFAGDGSGLSNVYAVVPNSIGDGNLRVVSGNVGVGVAQPGARLDVDGSAHVRGDLVAHGVAANSVGSAVAGQPLVVASSLLPSSNVVHDLGSDTLRWRDLYLSGNTINLGGQLISQHTDGVKIGEAVLGSSGVRIGNTLLREGTGGGLRIAVVDGQGATVADSTVGKADGTSSAEFFVGNGFYLTGIDASKISTGTLAAQRIPNNIADGSIVVTSGNVSLAKDLRVSGNLYVDGNVTYVDTETQVTDQVVITNAGTGPALRVVQTGTESIAEFVDDGNVAFKIWDGGDVSVGSNTLPLARVDVAGNVRASHFVGNGSLLTGVDAGSITSGTLSNARLPANLAVDSVSVAQNANVNGTAYFADKVAIANANPTWPLSVTGNTYTTGDLVAMGRLAIGTTVPQGPSLSYKITAATGAANSVDGIQVLNSTGRYVKIHPSTDLRTYNHLVGTGDSSIIFSSGTVGLGNLVIAPYANGPPGLKILNSGFLGIGAFTPLTALSVTPNVYSSKITLYDNANAAHHFGFGVSNNGQLNYHCQGNTTQAHVFWANGKNGDGTELLRIGAGGNVGIANSSPAHNLSVQGTGFFQGEVEASAFRGNGRNVASLDATCIDTGTLANERLPSSVTVSGTVTAGALAGNGSLLQGLDAGKISQGTLDTARLPSNVTVAGSVTAAAFSGNGASLTGLDAGSLTSGTLDAARVPFGIADGNIRATASNVSVLTDLRVAGNLFVDGNLTYVDTDVQVTDQVVVTNAGTGPALRVEQVGAQSVAEFVDDGVVALKIWDGGFVSVGSNVSPTSMLDVAGNVRASAFVGNGIGLGNLNASNITSGTLNNARLPTAISVTTVAGNGSGLTGLNASSIVSGTLNNARLPAAISVTSFAGNGSQIVGLTANAIATGTLDNARLPASVSVASLAISNIAVISSLDTSSLTGNVDVAFDFGGRSLSNVANVAANTVEFSEILVNTLAGDGSLLTDLDADNITSGTLANARLPSTVQVGNLVANGLAVSTTATTSTAGRFSSSIANQNCAVSISTLAGNGHPFIAFDVQANAWSIGVNNTDSDKFQLRNNLAFGGATTALSVTPTTGYVGIGNAAPAHALSVAGNGYYSSSVTATAFNQSSDVRLKHDVVVVDDALDKAAALRGVWYSDADGQRCLGLIAQETELVVPEVVRTDAHGWKTICYPNLVALLIEAVKSLKARTEAMQAQLDGQAQG